MNELLRLGSPDRSASDATPATLSPPTYGLSDLTVPLVYCHGRPLALARSRRQRSVPLHRLERSVRACRNRDNLLAGVRPVYEGKEIMGAHVVFEWDAPEMEGGGFHLRPLFRSALQLAEWGESSGVRVRLCTSGRRSFRAYLSTVDLGFDPRLPSEHLVARVGAAVADAAGVDGYDACLERQGQLLRLPGSRWRSLDGGAAAGWSIWFDPHEDFEDVMRRSARGPRPPVWLPSARWWGIPGRSPVVELAEPQLPAHGRAPREAGLSRPPPAPQLPVREVLAALGIEVSNSGRLPCPHPEHRGSTRSATVWEAGNAVTCWSQKHMGHEDGRTWSPVRVVAMTLGISLSEASGWLERLALPEGRLELWP